jgi:hypothetical protein
MDTHTRRRWAVRGAWLALGLLVLWLVVQWARGTLAGLVWFVVWYLNLVLRGFHQALFWGLFLALAVAIALLTLARGARFHRRAAARAAPAPGPVQQLARSIRLTRQGHYFKWSLGRDLGALVVEALDGEEGLDQEAKRKLLERADRSMPPEVRAYVDAAMWGTYAEQAEPRARWLRFLPKPRPPSPLDLDPAVVAEYLERQLEVANDRRHG